MINLTLTSVVFESFLDQKIIYAFNHLTLTSVVFESLLSMMVLLPLQDLTLTSVVFELEGVEATGDVGV